MQRDASRKRAVEHSLAGARINPEEKWVTVDRDRYGRSDLARDSAHDPRRDITAAQRLRPGARSRRRRHCRAGSRRRRSSRTSRQRKACAQQRRNAPDEMMSLQVAPLRLATLRPRDAFLPYPPGARSTQLPTRARVRLPSLGPLPQATLTPAFGFDSRASLQRNPCPWRVPAFAAFRVLAARVWGRIRNKMRAWPNELDHGLPLDRHQPAERGLPTPSPAPTSAARCA